MSSAITYQDRFLESLWPPSIIQGKIWGSSHWKSCTYRGHKRNENSVDYSGYIDLSETVEKAGKNCHPIYYIKAPGESWHISLGCSLSVVAYVPAVVAFHLLRIAMVTLYLALRVILYDSWARNKEESFCSLVQKRIVQIGREDWRSLSTILRTPICALGFLLSNIYVLFFDSMQWTHDDGLNGRKMVASFERAWNRWVPVNKSFWILSPGRNFEFEGRGDPEKMGQYSLYLPGCYQPIAYAEVKDGKLASVVTDGGNFVFEKYARSRTLKDM